MTREDARSDLFMCNEIPAEVRCRKKRQKVQSVRESVFTLHSKTTPAPLRVNACVTPLCFETSYREPHVTAVPSHPCPLDLLVTGFSEMLAMPVLIRNKQNQM